MISKDTIFGFLGRCLLTFYCASSGIGNKWGIDAHTESETRFCMSRTMKKPPQSFKIVSCMIQKSE